MIAFSVLVDIGIVVLVLYRQRQIRRVPRRLHLRLPILLFALGLVELSDFTRTHHLSGSVIGVLALSLVVAAGGLGALRALTVRLRAESGWVFQQGTNLTMALWLVSIGLHFGTDWEITHLKGPHGLATVSVLLYLGITLGVQQAIVNARAQKLFDESTPIDAFSEVIRGFSWLRQNRTGSGGPSQRGTHPPIISAESEVIDPGSDDRGSSGVTEP